ncbi:hypothetical protein THRCLA_22366 [Thraustotheca clavata]|uniref:Uncharacterized protein n=1 Tax=Thraustotheca clavata TaxID=74557 RepID=A0A1V9Z3V2_9STRA|nr:hypothetical protein THRCLA_22366 [Thraustotheca clavata]
MYDDLTTLHNAIQGLRTLDATFVCFMATQYCWVDFSQRWELGHIAIRQAHYYSRYKSNGAMYLESVLRNIEFAAWTNFNLDSSLIRDVVEIWNAGTPLIKKLVNGNRT